MIFGQTIPASTAIFGPWMPRGADNGIFTYESIGVDESNFTVKIFHKNREEGGYGEEATPSSSWTEIGTDTDIVEGSFKSLKELVRVRVQNTDTEARAWRAIGWTWYNTPNAS